MSTSEVIDWDEAMQQCGEDEEFLRELLADLRSETDTQMAKIEETIMVSLLHHYSVSSKDLSTTVLNLEVVTCGSRHYLLFYYVRCISYDVESHRFSLHSNHAGLSRYQRCRLKSNVFATAPLCYEFGDGGVYSCK